MSTAMGMLTPATRSCYSRYLHIPKWLIATAALSFVALIAAVAFFVGRQSAPVTAASVVEAPAQEPAPAGDAPQAAAPVTDTGSVAMPSSSAPSNTATTASDLPASTTSASASTIAPSIASDIAPATADARARVSAYFEQLDALQSGAPIGDQQTFAATLLQGATTGDFSGIDDLVRAAGDAERRALALQPPAECAEYHRMVVTLLQESRTMVTALRDGLKRNDTTMLTSLGATAQSMKTRADALAAAEKSLRARFGL